MWSQIKILAALINLVLDIIYVLTPPVKVIIFSDFEREDDDQVTSKVT